MDPFDSITTVETEAYEPDRAFRKAMYKVQAWIEEHRPDAKWTEFFLSLYAVSLVSKAMVTTEIKYVWEFQATWYRA